MKIHLKYFASIRESLGTGAETVETTADTLASLRAELLARGGNYAECLAPGRAVRVALDQVMINEAAALTDGCEVAFFPPVTGG